MGSRLRTASWVLLTIVGGLTLLFSLVSTYWAYLRQLPDRRRAGRGGGGGPGGHPHRASRDSRNVGGLRRRLRGAVPGHRARSLPQRRHPRVVDDPLATLAMALIVLARIPTLGVALGQGGTPVAYTLGGLIVLGLLLDVGRLSPH